MSAEYDCVVVGGGPAGAAAAIAAARLGRHVAVVEPDPPGDGRARIGETLPASIQVPLCALGAWDRFLASGPLPAAAIRSAWGQPSVHESASVFDPYGPGWHVDRQAFDRSLLDTARDAGADVWWGARVLEVDPAPAGEFALRVMRGDRSTSVVCRTVVDATGRGAKVARRLGACRRTHDHLVGVVAFVAPSELSESDGATLIEADETGWWYSAPLPTGRLVLAYMTDADLCGRHPGGARGLWMDALGRSPLTAARARRLAPDTLVRVYAAASQQTVPAAGIGWAAVGDAAAARDPLSSGGIFEALRSGQAAALALTLDASLGDRSGPAAYAEASAARFRRYLDRRNLYYLREQRWRSSPFWRRRHSKGTHHGHPSRLPQD
jgi:flavin-dependent dehydrogenase